MPSITAGSVAPLNIDNGWWFTGRSGNSVSIRTGSEYAEHYYGYAVATGGNTESVRIMWDSSTDVWASTGGWLTNSSKTDFANRIACFDMVASLSARIMYIAAVKTDRSLILWKIENNVQSEVANRAAHTTNTGNQRLVMCSLPGGKLGIVTMDTACRKRIAVVMLGVF